MTQRPRSKGEKMRQMHVKSTHHVAPAPEPEKALGGHDSFMQSWKALFKAHDYSSLAGSVNHFTSMDTSKIDFKTLPVPATRNGDLILDMRGNESMIHSTFFSPGTHSWLRECRGKVSIQEVLERARTITGDRGRYPGFRELKAAILAGGNSHKWLQQPIEILFGAALVAGPLLLWNVGSICWDDAKREFDLSLPLLSDTYTGQTIAVIPLEKTP